MVFQRRHLKNKIKSERCTLKHSLKWTLIMKLFCYQIKLRHGNSYIQNDLFVLTSLIFIHIFAIFLWINRLSIISHKTCGKEVRALWFWEDLEWQILISALWKDSSQHVHLGMESLCYLGLTLLWTMSACGFVSPVLVEL